MLWLTYQIVDPRIAKCRQDAELSWGIFYECCAAATMELHEAELKIINMIYCHVVSQNELMTFFD